jgi:monooxygenase
MTLPHFDVLIVGAGLSGIGAGVHLQRESPGKTYAILEAREAMGGTWDLFRYPGIRSDSDMYTLGYSFRPWVNEKSIADGADIRQYIRDTARDYGVEAHIRFRHRVTGAAWSSREAKWTVEAERADTGETARFTCHFLYMCGGYYRYDAGYTPDWPGRERFTAAGGRIVHPQKWTDDVDYAGKRVVVIGSGATAVTLVPALAEKAKHVVMLQRSPSYIASLPARDPLAKILRKLFVPERIAYAITRWKNVLRAQFFYWLSRRHPATMKKILRMRLREALGATFPIDPHFRPRYNPWDQRLCLVPDEDLFKSIKAGTASVATDEIETFTEKGVKLKSGSELEADLVVTATGLALVAQGGTALTLDGKPVDVSKAMIYRGMMLSDVPNFAFAIGYTNASWTLKVDLVSRYVCRLLNHMDAHGYRQCVPRLNDPDVKPEPIIDFSSGYVLRAVDQLPKQGSKRPWRLYQNYAKDLFTFRFTPIEDGTMEFSGKVEPASATERRAA